MGWADIKKRYERKGRTSQSTEDMAARRILRAIGLTEPKLKEFEKENGLAYRREVDTTLLERALMAARGIESAFHKVASVHDVTSFKVAETLLMEVVDIDQAKAIVYRIKGGQDLRALIALGDCGFIDARSLPMPCKVCKNKDGIILADCDAQDYYNKIARKDSDE